MMSEPSLLAVSDSHRPLACDRLPTPVHFDHSSSSLLSPPLSRASSPLLTPLNLSTALPKALSPLPSPGLAPLVETRHIGKKTSAFFSSPFDRDSPAPSPPPPLRRPSISSTNSSLSSPPTANTALDKEKDLTDSKSDPLTSSGPSISANSSFFFAKGSATPTPPPSVHSTDDASVSRLKLPPISRFFPSRGRAVERSLDSSDDVRSGSLSSSPPSVRDFVTLEDTPSISSSPTDLTIPDSPAPKPDTSTSTPAAITHQLRLASFDLLTPSPATFLTPGQTIGTDTPLLLIRELGEGSFSRVWLARDILHKLEEPPHLSARLKSESKARKKGDYGFQPPGAGSGLGRSGSLYFAANKERGSVKSDSDSKPDPDANVVAVKMMDRATCDANDRTRVSFVREVEVLRHISHPSIVSYLHAFTISTHHCLVLEAIQGGELFELLEDDKNYSLMTESLLRRIFGELCQAVGWMHGVGLVHRDLKLENILLTTNPFLTNTLPASPSPLIKLTDFGLARFIDPSSPLLTTRCGSESYAAPEVVIGRPYDGRQTDAWACGVVLYALATRRLPFDPPAVEGEGGVLMQGWSRGPGGRGYLMRIAHGEYTWPDERLGGGNAGDLGLTTDGVKSVVRRLLVRDPSKRARVTEVWDEPWMKSEKLAETEIGGELVGNDIPSVAREEL